MKIILIHIVIWFATFISYGQCYSQTPIDTIRVIEVECEACSSQFPKNIMFLGNLEDSVSLIINRAELKFLVSSKPKFYQLDLDTNSSKIPFSVIAEQAVSSYEGFLDLQYNYFVFYVLLTSNTEKHELDQNIMLQNCTALPLPESQDLVGGIFEVESIILICMKED